MLKRSQQILSFLLLIMFVSACSSIGGKTLEYNIEKQGDNFLWKVEKNDSKAKVYLLGSIHLAKKDIYPMNEQIYKAYEESDKITVEVNIKNINPMDMMQYMMFPADSSLEMVLEKETYAKIISYFESKSMPALMINRFRPWAAAITMMGLELKENGYSEDLGIDNHFINKANKDKKEILELETFEMQANLFATFDKIPQEYMEFNLASLETSVDQVNGMLKAWQEGDEEAMLTRLNEGLKDYPNMEEFNQKFLVDRNVNMTKKIKEYFKTDKTYFVIVGAAHLIGEDGIVKLLNK